MSCQNRVRQGAASGVGIRSVRIEIQTCISNTAICDERCTKLQCQSRPLTQTVPTCGAIRGLCEKLSGLCVELRFTAKYAHVNAKGGAK